MPLPRKGSYAELLARANYNSCLVNDQATEPAKLVVKTRLQKLLKTLHRLTAAQRALIVEVLTGARKLVTVRGEALAVKRGATQWHVCGLDAQAVDRSVHIDASGCSCPQSSKLRKTCKHMEAVRATST